MRAGLFRRALAAPVVLATLTALPVPAAGQTGGVGPDQPTATPPAPSGEATGGVRYGQPGPAARPKPKPKPKRRRGPQIVALAVSPGTAFADGGLVKKTKTLHKEFGVLSAATRAAVKVALVVLGSAGRLSGPIRCATLPPICRAGENLQA